jgi:small basic protein
MHHTVPSNYDPRLVIAATQCAHVNYVYRHAGVHQLRRDIALSTHFSNYLLAHLACFASDVDPLPVEVQSLLLLGHSVLQQFFAFHDRAYS